MLLLPFSLKSVDVIAVFAAVVVIDIASIGVIFFCIDFVVKAVVVVDALVAVSRILSSRLLFSAYSRLLFTPSVC